MAKTKNTKNGKRGNKGGGKRPGPGGARAMMVGRGLDAQALAWARLLYDPCGAPMTSPCYPSGGSGMFVRVHSFFNPISVATNNSFQFSFSPGRNIAVFGQTAGAGTVGLIGAPFSVFNVNTTYDAFRCVAACVTLRYLGPESSRAGLVGSAVTGSPLLVGGTSVNSSGVLPQMQRVHRLGEVIHETKWVPTVLDGDFDNNFSDGAPANRSGTITYIGNETGSLVTLELTAVYEVIPLPGSGLVASQRPPASSNTVGDVLRAMGDASKWAFSNVVAPVIKASAGMALQTVSNAPQLMAGASRLAIAM